MSKWIFSERCAESVTSKDKRRAIAILEREDKRKYEKGERIWHAEGTGKVLDVTVKVDKGEHLGGTKKNPGLWVTLEYHVLFDDRTKRWVTWEDQFESEKACLSTRLLDHIQAGGKIVIDNREQP